MQNTGYILEMTCCNKNAIYEDIGCLYAQNVYDDGEIEFDVKYSYIFYC